MESITRVSAMSRGTNAAIYRTLIQNFSRAHDNIVEHDSIACYRQIVEIGVSKVVTTSQNRKHKSSGRNTYPITTRSHKIVPSSIQNV